MYIIQNKEKVKIEDVDKVEPFLDLAFKWDVTNIIIIVLIVILSLVAIYLYFKKPSSRSPSSIELKSIKKKINV